MFIHTNLVPRVHNEKKKTSTTLNSNSNLQRNESVFILQI